MLPTFRPHVRAPGHVRPQTLGIAEMPVDLVHQFASLVVDLAV
ncbi:MAG TPA: hypothetical protein VKB91_04285 [Gemmatimonadaceae bacterium]|nr:hypothetical protein [Gemmatimonadaceae bacterium]